MFGDNFKDDLKGKLSGGDFNFNDIFGGVTKRRLEIPGIEPEEVERYKKALKICKGIDKDCKISISLDFSRDTDTLVITDYDDATLLRLGLTVGAIDVETPKEK